MVEVEIFVCNKINQSKGLIYIHESNIPDIDEYCSDLKKEHNLSDVQRTTWIQTQKHYFHSTPTDFKEKEPPRFK